MKRSLACVPLLLVCIGCNVQINSDAGPTKTSNEEIDAGGAESARAEIRLNAGELHVQGGGPRLMSASFRYSEQLGAPNVRYERTGSSGLLTVESPREDSIKLHKVNEWTLRMGSQTPLEMYVNLGGGNADIDLSTLPLKSVDVQMGAGELHLNLAGNYKNDVSATVGGGAGSTEIRLPTDMGAPWSKRRSASAAWSPAGSSNGTTANTTTPFTMRVSPPFGSKCGAEWAISSLRLGNKRIGKPFHPELDLVFRNDLKSQPLMKAQ
jgi:hypothetical protein